MDSYEDIMPVLRAKGADVVKEMILLANPNRV